MTAIGFGRELRTRPQTFRRWTAASVVLCAFFLGLWLRHIDGSLPYPWDTDETALSGPASHMLTAGSLDPVTFIYPSLPKYLAAFGMSVGFLRGASDLEILEIEKMGNVGYPYYDTPSAMRSARDLFAILAVIVLAASAVAAWHAFRKPAAIFLTPLALSMSPLFFYHSWTYLNVDIAGTCFVMVALAVCLDGTRRPSMVRSAIIPGVFAGLAAASKYNLAIVIVPIVIAIAIYLEPGRRLWGVLAAIAAMVGAFLVVVPYSIIDLPAFLDGVAFDEYHYAQGHVGWEGDPGLAQLAYYGRYTLSEFGIPGAAAAVLGMYAHFRADWRRAVILVSFPVASLWLLTAQRVHFPRNTLSLYPIIALFLAFGVIALQNWASSYAARRGWSSTRTKRFAMAVSLFLITIVVPLWHLRAEIRDRTDSRKLASAWIEQRIARDWTIVIPSQLGFDARALKAGGSHVEVIDLQSAKDPDTLRQLLGSVQRPAVILAPHWGADSRFPGQDTANALNELSRQWRVMRMFGTNPVLVNYPPSTPWGDPAFAVAVLEAH